MSDMNDHRPTRAQKILWWLAGATTHILARCPTDHRKYSAIGVTMVIIPSMAAFSAGFAVQQTFGSLFVSVLASLVWLALVFNVDRLLLISLRKREGAAFKEFLMALPRLLMVVVLSFLITEPLIHKLFEGEIADQLAAVTRQSAEEARRAAADVYGRETRSLEEENRRLVDGLEELRKVRDQRQKDLMEEGQGTGGTGTPGKGAWYAEKKAAYDLAAREYEDARAAADGEVGHNDARRAELVGKVEAAGAEAAASKDNARGFLARHAALMAVVRRDPGAGLIYYLLSLALILLESTPLCVKLFSRRGHYDQLLERHEQERVHEEKAALAESVRRVDLAREGREETASSLRRLRKEKLRRVTEAVIGDEEAALSGDDAEIAAALRKSLKASVLGELSHADRSAPAYGPAVEGAAARCGLAPLLVHVHGPEEEFFTVNFNRPEAELTGGDLFFALRGLGDLLPPNDTRRPLIDYLARGDGGAEIEADRPLFEQLGGSRVVHLSCDVQPGGDATN